MPIRHVSAFTNIKIQWIDLFASVFPSFYHALLASLLIYKPFQTNDTIQKYDRMLTTWLRSNILIMVNMLTIISFIKMEMVNLVTNVNRIYESDQ